MKNFKKILSNQQGISLIEITVAAAISVIISMGVVKTNQIGQKGMTKISTDLDLKMWQQQRLIQTLGEPGACANTFPGHSIDLSSIISEIRDSENNVVYSAGDDIEGGAWTIVSMAIVGVPAADISPAVNKYTTNFEINMRRKNSESYGAKVRKIFVPIVIVRASDPSTQLVSCSAGSVGADGLWNQELANGGYIHSAGGNVLIGSNGSDPTAPFQIDINSGLEWPGVGSGIRPSMKVSSDGNAIVFGSVNQAAIYQTETCLTVGNGMSGDITSKIESCHDASPDSNFGIKIGDDGNGILGGTNTMILNANTSIAQGDHSIVLGGSSSTSSGLHSVVSNGYLAEASGSYSFASGQQAKASGYSSAAIGHYAQATGMMSVALGGGRAHGDYSIGLRGTARGRWSTAVMGGDASGDTSVAIGFNSRARHEGSMVFSSNHFNAPAERYATYSTNDQQFTAQYKNGFKFITGSSNYPDVLDSVNGVTEKRSVFIDPNGNMGIGSDLSQSPVTSFTEDRTPKLFVNGDVEIYGDLYVNGQKVEGSGTPDTGWLATTMPSGGSAYWTSSIMCRVKDGIVHLKGYINKTGNVNLSSSQRYIASLPSICMPTGYSVRISVMTCSGEVRNINLNQIGVSRAGQLRPTNRSLGASYSDDNWFVNNLSPTNNSDSTSTCYIFFDEVSYIKDRI